MESSQYPCVKGGDRRGRLGKRPCHHPDGIPDGDVLTVEEDAANRFFDGDMNSNMLHTWLADVM